MLEKYFHISLKMEMLQVRDVSEQAQTSFDSDLSFHLFYFSPRGAARFSMAASRKHAIVVENLACFRVVLRWNVLYGFWTAGGVVC